MPPRMRARVCAKERVFGLRREMADFEDGIEVLDGDRNRIGRIRNLADEAAVFAHRMRQPNAHA